MVKHSDKENLNISDLFSQRDFTAAMRAKLLNKIMQSKNPELSSLISLYFSHFIMEKPEDKIKFYANYEKDILSFRNALAHVNMDSKTEGDIFIGVNNVDYNCDDEFCSIIRKNLLMYRKFFASLCNNLRENY